MGVALQCCQPLYLNTCALECILYTGSLVNQPYFCREGKIRLGSLETRPSPSSSSAIVITLTFEPYRSYGGRSLETRPSPSSSSAIVITLTFEPYRSYGASVTAIGFKGQRNIIIAEEGEGLVSRLRLAGHTCTILRAGRNVGLRHGV